MDGSCSCWVALAQAHDPALSPRWHWATQIFHPRWSPFEGVALSRWCLALVFRWSEKWSRICFGSFWATLAYLWDQGHPLLFHVFDDGEKFWLRHYIQWTILAGRLGNLAPAIIQKLARKHLVKMIKQLDDRWNEQLIPLGYLLEIAVAVSILFKAFWSLLFKCFALYFCCNETLLFKQKTNQMCWTTHTAFLLVMVFLRLTRIPLLLVVQLLLRSDKQSELVELRSKRSSRGRIGMFCKLSILFGTEFITCYYR